MDLALHALTEELRRLKAAGWKSVNVSESALVQLRAAYGSRSVEVSARRAPAESRIEPAPAENVVAREAESAVRERAAVVPGVSIPVLSNPPVNAGAVVPSPVDELPAPPTIILPAGDKATRWAALRQRVLDDPVCRRSVRSGRKVVFGVGDLDAKIMFVGEAPGAEEELQGEPFVGPAGQLLTKMIVGMGLQRTGVYISNIMSWRPQIQTADGVEQVGNRPPTDAEMNYCLPYLRSQIEIVDPDLIVALGSTAAQGLLGRGSFKALGDVRSLWHEFSGKPLMVTYHPSYILRSQSNRSKRMIWEDLLRVMERAALPISERQRGFFLDK